MNVRDMDGNLIIILFNSSKSAVMYSKPDFMKNINFPIFKINNESIICNDSSDNFDILRQRRKIYTTHLWINYTNTIMNKLYTAYHNVLKMFIGVSKCEHTRPICATLNVKYCPALIRNFINKFMYRLQIVLVDPFIML